MLKNLKEESNGISWKQKTLIQILVEFRNENGNLVSFNGQSIIFDYQLKKLTLLNDEHFHRITILS